MFSFRVVFLKNQERKTENQNANAFMWKVVQNHTKIRIKQLFTVLSYAH